MCCKWVLLLTAVLLAVVNPLAGATPSLTAEQALEDAEFLFKKMDEIHPNLYHQFPYDQAMKEYQALTHRLSSKDSWTKLELYPLFASFMALFRDGHTGMHYPYRDYDLHRQQGGRFFPMAVSIESDRLFVLQDRSSIPLELGTEILEINGIPISRMISEILASLSYERLAFGECKLQRDFAGLLWAHYSMTDEFRLVYQETAESPVQEVVIAGITFSDIQSPSAEPPSYTPFRLRFVHEDIAHMEIDTFGHNSQKELKEFLASSFQELKDKEIPHLIIDIRQNRGGSSSTAQLLLDYLTDQPYRHFSSIDTRYSPYVLDQFWWPARIWLQLRFLVQGSNIVSRKQPWIKPEEHQTKYIGQVYVLAGTPSYSAASDFAAVVQDFNIGIIAGQETGGLATSYGDNAHVTLPHSQLSATISYKFFVRPSGDMSLTGVIPDWEIPRHSFAAVDEVKDPLEELVTRILHEETED